MTPCLLSRSFAFRHFQSITAAVPGQAFLFFMVSSYKNILAMAQVLCQVSCPVSLGWTVKLGQAVSFTGVAGGATILAEQISSPCHSAGLHPGEKGTDPAAGRPWK